MSTDWGFPSFDELRDQLRMAADTLTTKEAGDLQRATYNAEQALDCMRDALGNVFFDESMTRAQASGAAYDLRSAAETVADAMNELIGSLDEVDE